VKLSLNTVQYRKDTSSKGKKMNLRKISFPLPKCLQSIGKVNSPKHKLHRNKNQEIPFLILVITPILNNNNSKSKKTQLKRRLRGFWRIRRFCKKSRITRIIYSKICPLYKKLPSLIYKPFRWLKRTKSF
jgi:hypothetical protein